MNKRLLLGLSLLSLTCSSKATTGDSGASTGSGGANSGSGGAANGSGGAVGTGGTASGTGGATGGTAGVAGTGGTIGGAAGRGAGGIPGLGGAAGRAGAGGVSGTGGTPAGSGGAGGAPGGGVSVLQHHNNPSRDGVYVDSRLTRTAAATMHIDATFAAAAILGPVYAQPLYLVGANGGPDLIIAATAQNRVYALNAATGVEVWNRLLGTPVTSGLCGRPLNPLGITGTPVIDAATRTIYLDAMTNMGPTDARHLVHALDVDNLGVDRAGWPVDLNATARSGGTTFLSPVQNQRAALALIGGSLFVPFGGHIGDCDAYHGWLVGIATTNPAQVTSWATTAFAGGIWGSSGIASDGSALFVSTGNTKALATSGGAGSSPVNWGGGEAVIKFPTSLTQPAMAATTDYFYPSDWAAMDVADADLGGTGVVLFNVPGATPSNLLMALGKDRKAYLLNRANLGGLDAQPLAGLTMVAGQQIITAAAAYTTATGTYVVFKNGGASGCPAGQSGGLTAIKVSAASPPTMAIAWCGGPATNGSPAVSMTDAIGANAIVWVVGNDNRLYGVNGDTGAAVPGTGGTNSAMAAVQSIQTPIVANGRVIVASNTRIYAFLP